MAIMIIVIVNKETSFVSLEGPGGETVGRQKENNAFVRLEINQYGNSITNKQSGPFLRKNIGCIYGSQLVELKKYIPYIKYS